MAINKLMDKVGNVLFDLTGDTTSENNVAKGVIFHDKYGNQKVGLGISDDASAIAAQPAFFTDNVVFYDYDYSFAYVYTNDEAKALTTLPEGKAHDDLNLTFLGWNFDIKEVNELITHRVYPMYKTSDGIMYIGVEISSDNFTLSINSTYGNMYVNWGDGTSTTQGTSSHTYEKAGTYKIAINSSQKTFSFVSPFSSNNNIIRYIFLSEYCTSFGSNCLQNANKYFYMTMHNKIVDIRNYAFADCSGLSSVVIPSSVTSIGNYAFSGCYSLSSVAIPSSVTSIGSYAFYYCYGLSSIVIPSSVTSIGSQAFYNCYGLSSVVIPSSVTSIESIMFYNCKGLSSVVIPSSVTSIGSQAFCNCYGLSSVVIPSLVTSIGSSAFSSCYGLSSIVIPSSVTSIEEKAFENCFFDYMDLTELSEPPIISSVKNVGYNNPSSPSSSNIPHAPKYFIKPGTLSKYASATNWSLIYAERPDLFVEMEL